MLQFEHALRNSCGNVIATAMIVGGGTFKGKYGYEGSALKNGLMHLGTGASCL
jgi:hypothetical protein